MSWYKILTFERKHGKWLKMCIGITPGEIGMGVGRIGQDLLVGGTLHVSLIIVICKKTRNRGKG